MKKVDLLIVGGGLAGGLLALAIRARRPGTRVMLVEGADRIGGNHIWSFFGSDVAPEDWGLVAPLISHSWEGYDVAFPRYRRTIANSYHSIESERLDAVVRAALTPEDLVTGARVLAIDRGGVTLADGSRIEAEACIEARGARDLSALELGWQKFVGQLLVLDRPHGLTRPTIMDATVDQADGYRFVYLLPFGPDRIFVEDTYYTTTPDLDVPAIRQRIADYAAARGWSVRSVEREEVAALPIATGGHFELHWRSGPQWIGKIGMAAALFQPMTGYSLPDAVRTAALVAALPSLDGQLLHDALRTHAEKAWADRSYYRLLARMLFRAAAPMDRYRMLERFYALDPKLVSRFYAGQSTKLDKIRILCGKPPVPLVRAARIFLEGSA
ncbi:lycopene beta-cyclase CrtY [Sphingomonas sp. BIUV-7]|uniref:Lycopene beta-cyclase CrtY n=1 Tax=Sphingomonas natans TaxID=3063330 RepID=A0ABT8YCA3_9SPHN|nr:lycopene beta-cyclase CrtY [Sphingomonas sp. BIUV-7]MDO6415967.1 lycopene beta-cyclase CrtY [Sphingomonas sp. BIUV-7]